MKQFRIERTNLCTLLDTYHVQKVKVQYDVVVTDDGIVTETIVHNSIELLDEPVGRA